MANIFSLAMRGTRGALIGGAIGGAVGGIASDANTATGRFESAMSGAALGALGGFGISKAGRALAWTGTKAALRKAPRAGIGMAKAGVGVGRFALRHPYATAAIGMGGLGAYGLAVSGPQDVNRTANEMAQMAALYGTSTGFEPGEGAAIQQMDRIAFENSAEGLVHGMNRRRHG